MRAAHNVKLKRIYNKKWDEKSDTNILQILIKAIYSLRQEIQPEAGGKEFL